MKILVISAIYPPDHTGGYEIRIKDIVSGLAERGHILQVLTTKARKKITQEQSAYRVFRVLHNRYTAKFFPKEVLFDLLDTNILQKTIKKFKPDVIYLGHTYFLSKAILPYLAGISIPLVYDEGANGLKGAWTERGRWFRFCGEWQCTFPLVNKLIPFVIKAVKALSRGRIMENWQWPENMRIMFNSALNLENARSFGVPVDNARVVHSGVDTEKFTFKARDGLSSPLRIIIPGRIEEKKGQLDGVRLVHTLQAHGVEVVLTLVGSIAQKEYFERIKAEIAQYGLLGKVIIHPFITQEELVSLYHQSDICYFSSYHHSGFSRVPLEAMASGCLVISYGNEGSDEVIIQRENGILLDEGDIEGGYDLVSRLFKLPGLYLSLISNAHQLIEKDYCLITYIDTIERFTSARQENGSLS